MKIDIKCEVHVTEAKVKFGNDGMSNGSIEFQANVYLCNNSKLRVKDSMYFQVNLEPNISELIRGKLESEALKSLTS